MGSKTALAATVDYYGPDKACVDADRIVEYIETLDDRLKTVTNVFEDHRRDDMVTRLARKLQSLAGSYEKWTATYAQRLTCGVAAIDAVKHYLADLPSFGSVESASFSADRNEDNETAEGTEAVGRDWG